MQYLLLARHGNTFDPGQKVVWVGARNDLPLVESGIAQAYALAENLRASNVIPHAIYAASLKRTITYAEIIHDQLNLQTKIKIDSRLNEIDYGSWSGLSNDEIKAQYESDELDAWTKEGKWAKSFAGSEYDVEREVNSFAQEVIVSAPEKKIVLAVTSNGRLKYFLKMLPHIYSQYLEQSKWKVGTGQLCIFAFEKKVWHLVSWNKNPRFVSDLLKSEITTLADNN